MFVAGLQRYFIKYLNQQYWDYFEALRCCTESDLKKVVCQYQPNQEMMFTHAVKFIVSRAKFFTEEDLKYFKTDLVSLL